MVETVAEELDELLDDAALAQHLRAGQHQVGGRDALFQAALQSEADHLGDDHGDRLAEHGGLGLDAADAPAEHGEAVDHRRVAVGADAGVGERLLHLGARLRPDGLREILEVHLMADAGARRHDLEVVEGRAAPAQEFIALLVALVLDFDVLLERVGRAEVIDHHRVVDDEIDRHQRIDLRRVTAHRLHGVAHGGQIDDAGDAGEVLQEHAGWAIGDLGLGGLGFQPFCAGSDVGGLDGAAVLVAQQVLEQHLERERQLRDPGQAVFLGVRQRKILVALRADRQRLAALEAVERGGDEAHGVALLNRLAACGCRDPGRECTAMGLTGIGWPPGGCGPYKAQASGPPRARCDLPTSFAPGVRPGCPRPSQIRMHLRVDSLTSERGGRIIIDGLSLDIAGGEALILVGPNGAGKTTFLRTLAGFIRPVSGRVTLDGGLPDTPVGEQCHFVGHQDAVKAALTVHENAAFWSRYMAGAASDAPAGTVKAALARLGIAGLADIPAAYLSAGQRRRLALTRLLVARRPVWLLDEPSVSLDADGLRTLADMVAGHVTAGGIVVAATHVDLAITGARELRLGQRTHAVDAA